VRADPRRAGWCRSRWQEVIALGVFGERAAHNLIERHVPDGHLAPTEQLARLKATTPRNQPVVMGPDIRTHP